MAGPVERTAGGRRRYAGDDIDWLRICVRLPRSGMPLAEARVDAQIRALDQVREIFTWKTDVYQQHLQGRADMG